MDDKHHLRVVAACTVCPSWGSTSTYCLSVVPEKVLGYFISLSIYPQVLSVLGDQIDLVRNYLFQGVVRSTRLHMG